MACLHERFTATVNVLRLQDVDDGPVTHYAADVRIRCEDCQQPFRFKGLPWGMLNDCPTTDVTAQELHAPIELATEDIPDRPYQRGVFEAPPGARR